MSEFPENPKSKGNTRWLKDHWLDLSLVVFVLLELLIMLLVPVFSECKIQDQSVQVYGSDSTILSFLTPNGLSPNLLGSFNVSDGEAISVLIFDEGAFTNWRNHRNATSLFSIDQTTFGRVNVLLKENENYRIIFENAFSSVNKSISVYLTIYFIPTIYGVPAAYVYRFMPVLPLSLLVALRIHFSKRDQTEIIPKETIYLLLCLVALLALATTLAPPTSMSEAFSRTAIFVDSIVAFVSIFVSITALRISRESGKTGEKMMRAQLVYNDRKRAIEKLISIVNEKGYSEITKRYFEFVSSVDWLYIPEEMRTTINEKIAELISFYHDSNPSEPDYSDEEIDAMLEQYDQLQAEEYETMDDIDRFEQELGTRITETRTSVEEVIKNYLGKLSKE